jgi:hypothetical protein
MADPGVSTQNFLRLLLGGAQRGADVFQQRQTMQQQQQPDLLLALQQMMQRKQMADVEQGQRERQLEMQHGEITANRMRQGGLDYQSALQQGIENRRADATFGLRKQEAQANIDRWKALADKYRNQTTGGTKPDASEARLSIKALLDSAEGADENYDYLPQEQFDKLDAVTRTMFSQHFATERDEGGNPINVVRYRRLRPGAAKEIAGYKAVLKQLGGLEEPSGIGAAPANTFPEDDDDADAYFQSLYDQVGE